MRNALLGLAALLAGCVTTRGPDAAVEAYARALEDGQLQEAWRSLGEGGGSWEAFQARYADPALRRARAAELRAALPALRAVGPGVELAPGTEGWRVVEPASQAAGTPEDTLRAFLRAAQGGDFSAAYRLLAAPQRARYTPELLARDFRAEPSAGARLARAREALAASPQRPSDGEALFPIGSGRAVRLVREGGVWRVAALE